MTEKKQPTAMCAHFWFYRNVYYVFCKCKTDCHVKLMVNCL